jgi:hypothetical protein
MEVRNVTPLEIEQAMEEATKQYNGNLYLKSSHVRVTLPKSEWRTEEHGYTKPERWGILYCQADPSKPLPEDWSDYGFTPYEYNLHKLDEQDRLAREKELCEQEVEKLRSYEQSEYGPIFGAPTFYRVEWLAEEDVSYTTTHKHRYEYTKALALNKKGTRYRIWIGVKSARRPGARVSPPRFYQENPRRIGSACWHAHRDFFRAIFDINPDAEIHTALAKYKGRDDFERKYPATAYGGGMAGAAPVGMFGDACNCDEGDYSEMAVEGLTEKQYEERLWIWEECEMKVPKRERAIVKEEDAA